jgi:hypothetical protein
VATPPRKRAQHQRWHPTEDYTIRDIRAIQALAQGKATEDDQRVALDWIINKAAQTYEEPFVAAPAGGDDVRCYLLGRRSVGLAIVKLMKLKPDLFSEKPQEGEQ